jgi:flagellar biosynthesis protein FliR
MTEILVSQFVTFVLIFVRLAVALSIAPVFGNRVLPAAPRLMLALIISYIMYFSVPSYQFFYYQGLLWLAVLGLAEAIVGMIIGFSMNFIFYGLSFAGHIIGFETGLTMAFAFDPGTELENNVLGAAFTLAATVIFLIIDGHHYLIQAIYASYELAPLGTFEPNAALQELFIRYSAGLFIVAVQIAAPFFAAFFLLHVAAGLIARMIPQMQVFFVLLPVKIGLGFALLIAMAPILVFAVRKLLEEFETSLYQIVKAIGQ